MRQEDQSAALEWNRDVPVSTRYGDSYYGDQDGLGEARHVFLAGNGLPDRFEPGFHIAELGFGTGLNVLAAWIAWRDSGTDGSLTVTSFEAHPLGPDQMTRAHRAFPDIAGPAQKLRDALARDPRYAELPGLDLTIIHGDANRTLPEWAGRADAWFLDGFAPAKNPAMWADTLLAEVASRTAPGGTAATFTAAGHVRRGLSAAGFGVDRMPGFGRKHHMTVARLP